MDKGIEEYAKREDELEFFISGAGLILSKEEVEMRSKLIVTIGVVPKTSPSYWRWTSCWRTTH